MRRTPLSRRTPLKAGKPLQRRKPLKAVSGLETRSELKRHKPLRKSNPERRKRKHARNHGEHSAFIRSLPCAVRQLPSCRENRWRIVPAHAVATGMGGCKGTFRDTVPLSWDLHQLQHNIGIDAFEERFGVPLLALRHVLMVADPGMVIHEQLEAWRRLYAEHSDSEICAALQLGKDLTGHFVKPPAVGQEKEVSL